MNGPHSGLRKTVSSSRPGDAILRLEDIALHFDEGRTKAVNGIDVEVREGEFVALVGPSGCGKSSLLNIIGTLDSATGGRIYFRGQPYSTISDASLFRRQHFGFIFQSFHLIPTLSALENVIVPTIGCAGSAKALKERAQGLLSALGLQDRMGHEPGKLSGGERQRVAIARSLINDPDIILADEPTGSLDSINAAEVLDLLDGIRKENGLTVVMVTHAPEVSARADRVVHMRDGKLDTNPAEHT